MLLKSEIEKIFTKQEQSQENSVENVDNQPQEECKEYITKECDGNIYVEIEKDKNILEFYDLGSFKDKNLEDIHLYTPHFIDIENKLYGRYKLDSKKLEDITNKDNFTLHTYSDHIEIVKSYKHIR